MTSSETAPTGRGRTHPRGVLPDGRRPEIRRPAPPLPELRVPDDGGLPGWYLLYVVLSAFGRGFMDTKVVGNLNVAFFFGLLQFVSTFLIAWVYSRFADRRIDPLARELRRELQGTELEAASWEAPDERRDRARRQRRHPARADDRPVPRLHRHHALHHVLGQPAEQDRRGLLRRRPVVLGLPERPGDRRRLHVRRLVPRHRRADRAVRLRRLPLLDRLPGRVAGRAAAGRRADAQLRPLHDGRRARVPDAAAPGPDGGRHLHHHRVDLLPDRADGRRRRAGRAAAGHRQDRDLPRHVPEHREERHHRARRRADDPLRHRRRHAWHHLGADRSRPAC